MGNAHQSVMAVISRSSLTTLKVKIFKVVFYCPKDNDKPLDICSIVVYLLQ